MRPLPLAKAVEFYLQQRRQLGFPLKEDGQMLRQLVGYALERAHRGPLTNELALAWAQAPAQSSRLWWARRLDAARRFAIFWRAFDPRTEVPPPGAFGPSSRRRAVHLYTRAEIAALMQAALTFRRLRGRLGWTQQPAPRLHDLRHTFAVGCLMDWYRQGDQIAQKVLALATYLGHSSIQGTYWYLSAVPELLALAHARWPALNIKPGGSHV